MAGYFSNHSQSRFLANAASNQHNSTSTASSTSSTTAHTPGTSNANSPKSTTPQNTLPRVASSKHFSTSVSNLNNSTTSGDEKTTIRERTGAGANGTVTSPSPVHPLRNTWVFWFRQHRAPGNKIINYEEGIKRISSFSSVESFWSLWTHLNPPSSLQPTTDYLLFHSAIRRPVWEDPLNRSGGKWIIRLKKGVADRLWEDIVLAVVGDQFDDCGGGRSSEEEPPEICGCTISVRQSEDVLSIWNREGNDTKVTERIKDTIRKVLNIGPLTVMEYKTNNDSMRDKPNFPSRNFTHDRTPS